MKVRSEYTCPLEIVHDLIKGKWKTIIVFALRNEPKSLAQLEKTIENISQKMLLEQLKELMEYKIVDKNTFEGYPLHVEYFLTSDRGQRMLEAVKLLQKIGIDFLIENGKEDELIKKGIICSIK